MLTKLFDTAIAAISHLRAREACGLALALTMSAPATRAIAAEAPRQHPNVVLILTDNLGWGELGVYGGGLLRGAPTPRLDAFAGEGMRLLNFNVEVSCSPTRSALLTGRFGIRSGNVRSGWPGQTHGLVRWEVTLGQLFQNQGYATALYGKWDVGDEQGRYPNDRGFDEWYGIPRSSNEALDRLSPGFDSKITPREYILEGRKGEPTKHAKEYTLEARREIDTELIHRTVDFIKREASAKKPFFAYVPLTQVHYPSLPSHAFEGRTGNGDFADAMVETDAHVGEILDALKAAGVDKDTLVIFTSDNGPESRRPWRGTSGFWRGFYRTALEGSLRTPFIIRWPGHIAPAVNNEMVHVVDLYPTLARVAGATVPTDRPIDGVDQLDFFCGKRPTSNREGFPVYIAGQPVAVKWRNWKYFYVWQPDVDQPAEKPFHPYLFNILWDPKEETPRSTELEDMWVLHKVRSVMDDFQASLKAHPPIPEAAPLDYVPHDPAVTPKATKAAEQSPG